MKAAHFNDYFRDLGVISMGFLGDTTRRDGRTQSGEIEIYHHDNMRKGWPYAVNLDPEYYRWDPMARCLEERQWAAYGRMWRIEDLKKQEGWEVPSNIKATHVAGIDLQTQHGRQARAVIEQYHESLGRVQVWQIWDQRTHKVMHWTTALPGGDCLYKEDWPFEIDGLPDVVLSSNSAPDDLIPVPEPQIVEPLQRAVNELVSLVLVYAKRGVPILGIRSGAITEQQRQLLSSAEILEQIETLTDPEAAIKLMQLNPNLAHLLQAISVKKQMLNEIKGVGRTDRGTRENVESAAEANLIAQGSSTRVLDRRGTVEEGYTKVARKFWQIFQQSPSAAEPQIVDIVQRGNLPQLFQLSPEHMKLEMDFEVQAGSTAPNNEDQQRRDAMAWSSATAAEHLQPHTSPRFTAENLARAFGIDAADALASQDAAQQQNLVNAMERMQFGGSGSNGASGRGPTDAAAMSAMRSNESVAEEST